MAESNAKSETLPALATPHPPRYWWLKRILLATAVVLAGLGLARWGWAVAAQRHLDAVVAEIQSRGEPLYAADFVRPPIPDDENAAYFLQQAAQAMVVKDNSGFSLSRVREDAALLDTENARVAALLAANSESLRLVREATARTAVDWWIDVRHGLRAMPSPAVRMYHELSDNILAAALFRHHEGRRSDALEFVLDAFRLSDAASANWSVGSQLLGLEIQFDAAAVLERVAPALTAGERTPVRAMIARLLDEHSLGAGWQDAMATTRATWLEYVQSMMRSGSPYYASVADSPTTWQGRVTLMWSWPMWATDAANMLVAWGCIAEAGGAADLETAQASLPEIPTGDHKLETHARPFSTYAPTPFAECLPRLFEARARRRLVATRLALRLYEIDHGRLPSTLSELVPDYLPAVPLDPLVAGGREIVYGPNGLSAGSDRLRVNVPLAPAPTSGPGVDHQDRVERQDGQPEQQHPADNHPQ